MSRGTWLKGEPSSSYWGGHEHHPPQPPPSPDRAASEENQRVPVELDFSQHNTDSLVRPFGKITTTRE
ncbi:hypothetical protein DMENIID0001_117960 [Sergentomyia squamirostris]